MRRLNSPYYGVLRKLLAAPQTLDELWVTIVDAPFHEMRQALHLDLGIVVLLLTNPQDNTIDRVALSNTPAADGALKMSEKPFSDIRIPLGHKTNVIARAIATGTPQVASDWRLLFVPALSAQAARFNQAGAGIECSHAYPLIASDGEGSQGALIFSFFQPSSGVGPAHIAFMQAYTALASEALQRLGAAQ